MPVISSMAVEILMVVVVLEIIPKPIIGRVETLQLASITGALSSLLPLRP